MLPDQQPDKDPLFKAGPEEHWASIPLKVHAHSYTHTHASTHTQTLTHTHADTLPHTVSRFDQVQLPSTTWCNYLWRSTHAFTLHSGIFIYIIYKRRWGDALHTNMFWTQHHDIFHNKPEVQSVMATPVDTNQNHKNWSLKINQFIKCLFENKTECSLKICCMMSVRGRFDCLEVIKTSK